MTSQPGWVRWDTELEYSDGPYTDFSHLNHFKSGYVMSCCICNVGPKWYSNIAQDNMQTKIIVSWWGGEGQIRTISTGHLHLFKALRLADWAIVGDEYDSMYSGFHHWVVLFENKYSITITLTWIVCLVLYYQVSVSSTSALVHGS